MRKLYGIIAILVTILIVAAHLSVSRADSEGHLLAKRAFSLNRRYSNTFVNDVFRDNILLTMKYLSGQNMEKNSHYEMELKPDEVFAFHDSILPHYQSEVVKTTNAHFSADEGFKSDGYLIGDGVCHLASLIYWAAKEAGLEAVAPVNHDFANIPEIPKEYGVAIFSLKGQASGSAQQNLYIKNNHKNPVVFKFDYDGENLQVAVVEG